MSDIISVIIVDDEPLAIQALNTVLKDIDDIKIIAECANGFETIKCVQELKPDILFLDIQMPKLDGFDVVELLGKEAPLIVFVTAYDEFAIKAFEAQAVDYLLKPVTKERLTKALEKVRSQLKLKEINNIEEIIHQRHRDLKPLSRIVIKDGSVINIVPVNEITHIEAQDDYVNIYTKDKTHLKYETLTHLEEVLDERQFCRIHRSYILNINFLKEIQPLSKDSRIAILKNGKNISISRSGYNRLKNYL
ncbi:MAG: response regulator [Calditrichia bacterium]|nr:response regulator [Calditrichia bacterium]